MAFLIRDTVLGSHLIEFLGHRAEALRVEPDAKQAALACGLSLILERVECVHHDIVVDDDQIAGLERKREAITWLAGDLIEQTDCLDFLGRERNAQLVVSGHESDPGTTHADLSAAHREDRNAKRGNTLLVWALLAQAVVMKSAIQHFEKVRRAPGYLVVDGDSADQC